MTPGMWQWCCCGGDTVVIAVAWTDSLNQEVVLAEYVGGDWRYETVGTTGVYYSSVPKLVYDKTGKPYVVYQNEAGKILLAYRNSDYGSGYTSIIVDNSAYTMPSLAVDNFNDIHMSYQQLVTGLPMHCKTWNGSALSDHLIGDYTVNGISQRSAIIGDRLDILTKNDVPTAPDYLDTYVIHQFDSITWTSENLSSAYTDADSTPTIIDVTNTIYASWISGSNISIRFKAGSTITSTAAYNTGSLNSYEAFAYKNPDDTYSIYYLHRITGNYQVMRNNYGSGTWAISSVLANQGTQIFNIDAKGMSNGSCYIVYGINSGGPRLVKYVSGTATVETLATSLSTNAYCCAIAVPGAVDQYYD